MLFKFFVTVVLAAIFAQVNFAHPTHTVSSLNGGGLLQPTQSTADIESLNPTEVKPVENAEAIQEKYTNQAVDAANEAIQTPLNFGASGQNLESFNFAENIEDLKAAFEAFNGLPEEAYDDLETSVKSIVAKIPGDNLIKSHLKNGLFIMSLYEKVNDGELDLNNPEDLMEVFEENPEAIEDLIEEIQGTGSMVTSTFEQAPYIEATKQSVSTVSEKFNTSPDSSINEHKQQPSVQPQWQAEVDDYENPEVNTNGNRAIKISPNIEVEEWTGSVGETNGGNFSW